MTQCGFGIYMVHYFVVGPFFLLIGPSEIANSVAGSVDGSLYFPLQLGIHRTTI